MTFTDSSDSNSMRAIRILKVLLLLSFPVFFPTILYTHPHALSKWCIKNLFILSSLKKEAWQSIETCGTLSLLIHSKLHTSPTTYCLIFFVYARKSKPPPSKRELPLSSIKFSVLINNWKHPRELLKKNTKSSWPFVGRGFSSCCCNDSYDITPLLWGISWCKWMKKNEKKRAAAGVAYGCNVCTSVAAWKVSVTSQKLCGWSCDEIQCRY